MKINCVYYSSYVKESQCKIHATVYICHAVPVFYTGDEVAQDSVCSYYTIPTMHAVSLYTGCAVSLENYLIFYQLLPRSLPRSKRCCGHYQISAGIKEMSRTLSDLCRDIRDVADIISLQYITNVINILSDLKPNTSRSCVYN